MQLSGMGNVPPIEIRNEATQKPVYTNTTPGTSDYNGNTPVGSSVDTSNRHAPVTAGVSWPL